MKPQEVFILFAKSFFLFTPHPDLLPQVEREIKGKNFWQSIEMVCNFYADTAFEVLAKSRLILRAKRMISYFRVVAAPLRMTGQRYLQEA
jgi:hypothetical protein